MRARKSVKNLEDLEEIEKPHGTTPSMGFGCGCCFMNKSRLCLETEVPEWMRRPHITSGYRPDMSPLRSFQSIVHLHNESGNIWTHLCGFAIVMCLVCRSSSEAEAPRPFAPELLPFEVAVLRIFLLAAAGCLLLSAAYHTGNCSHNQARCDALLRADASGVAVLIAASFLPGAYYGFACFPDLRHTYLCVTAGLLVVGLAVSVADALCSSKNPSNSDGSSNSGSKESSSINASNRGGENLAVGGSVPVEAAVMVPEEEVGGGGDVEGGEEEEASQRNPATTASATATITSTDIGVLIQRVRVATFVSSVGLGVAGILHWTFLVGQEARSLFLPKIVGSIGFYMIGFSFYASSFPERVWPGSFDYALHSHQIWHVCVVLAVLMWYWACVDTTEALGSRGCEAFVSLSDTRSSGSSLRNGLRNGGGRGGGAGRIAGATS